MSLCDATQEETSKPLLREPVQDPNAGLTESYSMKPPSNPASL